MPAPMLQIADLSKRYPNGTLALDQVSFDAYPGRVTAILGPNGSGKSTLVRCIVRLIDPTSGSIALAGTDLTTLAGTALRTARRRMGVVFQNGSLVMRRSSLANVASGCLGRDRSLLTACGMLPKAELERALPFLDRVGMAHVAHQRVDTLSGGQAQRVAIARALFQDPVVLLADEPVASLDPDAANEVMALLGALARGEGLAVVVVLHQLELARRYADQIIGLRDGRIVMDAKSEDLDMTILSGLYRADQVDAA
jgi:phosphonate transport system ATP-binding protein